MLGNLPISDTHYTSARARTFLTNSSYTCSCTYIRCRLLYARTWAQTHLNAAAALARIECGSNSKICRGLVHINIGPNVRRVLATELRQSQQ